MFEHIKLLFLASLQTTLYAPAVLQVNYLEITLSISHT